MRKHRTRMLIFFMLFMTLFTASGWGEGDVPEPGQNDPNKAEEPIFLDVPEGYWAKEDIEALYEIGALRVEKGEEFRPFEPITRAEFIHMLLKAKGIEPLPSMTAQSFHDVTMNDWYYPYVETAYSMGITNGKNMGNQLRFFPDESLSRQEFIVMTVRARGDFWKARNMHWKQVSNILSGFQDQDQLAEWARKEMALAIEVGMTRGYKEENGGQTLRPHYQTTRAEAASFIYRGIYKPRSQFQTVEVDGVTLAYKEQMTMEATAYTAGETGVGYWTATDMYVRKGIVAVDPNVIPFGTHLYVEGYGYAVAADRGSAIKQNKIDLYVPTLEEAYGFGRQSGVKVYILN